MSEKMLVTQALDERDLLVKKIHDKIRKASFVDVIKPNQDKVLGAKVLKQDFNCEAEAAYQQIMDLIDRFHNIDAAIVESNANTIVKTSYGEYTVAAAIALRKRLKGIGSLDKETNFERLLLSKLEYELNGGISTIEKKNGDLQETAETMRLSILGKDAKVKDDKPLEVVDAYVKENTYELVDPLGITKKIQGLKEKMDTLLSELDTQIKVSNATTFIEV